MAVYCPVKNGPALYMDCLECEDKQCRKKDKEKKENDRSGKVSGAFSHL